MNSLKYTQSRGNCSTICDHLGPQAKLLVFALCLKVFNLIQNQLDTLIHLDAVIEQALHRLGQWVILRLGSHGVGGESQFRRLLLAGLILLVENDPRRGSHRGRAGGNVFHDHGVRTDFRALSDDDGPEHLRPRTDDDPLPERRVALAFVPRSPAERHAVVQSAVVAQLCGLADHHPHAVVDEHAAADFRARMNLDAGEKTRDVRHEAGEPAHPNAPQPVRQAMNQERVKTGIAGEDFPGRTRRRVAFEYAGYVFANSGKHRDSRGPMPGIIGNLSELVNYFLGAPLSSQAASMPRRMLTSTVSSRAFANSRRKRSMSLRGARGCR